MCAVSAPLVTMLSHLDRRRLSPKSGGSSRGLKELGGKKRERQAALTFQSPSARSSLDSDQPPVVPSKRLQETREQLSQVKGLKACQHSIEHRHRAHPFEAVYLHL